MDRDQLIAAAVKLIAPPADQRDACRAEVAEELMLMDGFREQQNWPKAFLAKESRRAIQNVGGKAERLQIALRNLPPEVALVWSSTISELAPKLAEIRRLSGAFLAGIRPAAPKPDFADQQVAAARARALLHKFKLTASTAEDSIWCRLAAVIYGDPDANLRHACRKLATKLTDIDAELARRQGKTGQG